MASKILECPSEKQQKCWSDYVKLSKYFKSTLKRCQSMPCLSIAKERNPSFATPTERPSPHLSLSWQLACNPVDPARRQGCSTQRQQASDLLLCKNCRQVDLTALSSDRAKQKKMAQKQRESPKIVVVDANTMRAYWNQRHGDCRSEDRIRKRRQPPDDRELEKENWRTGVHKMKNPYAVPLCQRPTTILGSQLTAQQDLQQLQQQQYQEFYQAAFERHRLNRFQHVARLAQEQYVRSPKYAVPLESVYNQLKRGSRYCGNFYYR